MSKEVKRVQNDDKFRENERSAATDALFPSVGL